MKMGSKLILAGTVALSLLGAAVAGAQDVQSGAPAALSQAGSDSDGDGWLAWIGGHRGHDGHDGKHDGKHEGRGGDDDREHGCGEDEDDDEDEDEGGRCGAGAGPQPGTPPANGLFQNGQTPKVQVN